MKTRVSAAFLHRSGAFNSATGNVFWLAESAKPAAKMSRDLLSKTLGTTRRQSNCIHTDY